MTATFGTLHALHAQAKKTDGIAMFGSLPCLEDTDDDVKLNQSGAMLVYVAMKGGECGDTVVALLE